MQNELKNEGEQKRGQNWRKIGNSVAQVEENANHSSVPKIKLSTRRKQKTATL